MLSGWIKWIFLIGAVAAAVAAAFYFRPAPPPAAPPPVRASSQRVALELRREGDHLRVLWDRRNPAIRAADRAALHILDGNHESTLPLDAAELSGGSALYWPESDRFSFRLELPGELLTASAAMAPVPGLAPEKKPSAFQPAGRARQVERTPARRIRPVKAVSGPSPAAEKRARRSAFGRAISRVPLLRRLQKHEPKRHRDELDRF